MGALSSPSQYQLSPLSASERFSESVRSAMAEFLREAVGVEGRELSEELALNSSELRLSEASLRPLLMELLSSQPAGEEDQHHIPAVGLVPCPPGSTAPGPLAS